MLQASLKSALLCAVTQSLCTLPSSISQGCALSPSITNAFAFGASLRPKYCPCLHTLRIENTTETSQTDSSFFEGLTDFRVSKTLKSLHIDECLSLSHIQFVSQFTCLTHLFVNLPPRNASHFVEQLSSMTRLESLSLSTKEYVPISGLDFLVSGLSKLKHLTVPDIIPDHVAALPNSIETISINYLSDSACHLLSFARSSKSCLHTLSISKLSMEFVDSTELASRLAHLIAECEAAGVSIHITRIEDAYFDHFSFFLDTCKSTLIKRVTSRFQIVRFGNYTDMVVAIHGGKDALTLLTECCPNLTGGLLI